MLAIPRSVTHVSRTPPPLPLEAILSVPACALLKPAEIGAIVLICRALWAGGMPELPREESALMALSGAHLRQWREIRAPVSNALAAVFPHLASVYAKISQLQAFKQRSAARARTHIKREPKPVKLQDATTGMAPLVPSLAAPSTHANNRTNTGEIIPARVNRSLPNAILRD